MTQAQDELTQARERLAELETALAEATLSETDSVATVAARASDVEDAARAAAPVLRARDTANQHHWAAQNNMISAINQKAQATEDRDAQQILVDELVAAQE